MSLYYTVDEMLDFYRNNETTFLNEQIRHASAIMRLYNKSDKAKNQKQENKRGKMELNVSQSNTFILSKSWSSSGFEHDQAREVTRKINLVNNTNMDNMVKEFQNIDNGTILSCLITKATHGVDYPEKVSSQIIYVIQLYMNLSKTDQIYKKFPAELLQKYSEFLEKPDITVLKTVIVYISHLFCRGVIKRKEYGDVLYQTIKKLSVDKSLEVIFSALSVSGRFIDAKQYTEFFYFYRYFYRNYNSLSNSFLKFSYDELLRERFRGWPSHHDGPLTNQKNLNYDNVYFITSPPPLKPAAPKKLPCIDYIKQIYVEWCESDARELKEYSNYTSDETLAACFRLFEKHLDDKEDFTLFVSQIWTKIFYNQPQEKIIDCLKKNLPIFTEEMEGLKSIWDTFGMLLWQLTVSKSMQTWEAFDILSLPEVPEEDGFRNKYNIVCDESLVWDYEWEKIKDKENSEDIMNEILMKTSLIFDIDYPNLMQDQEFLNLVHDFDPRAVFVFIKGVIFGYFEYNVPIDEYVKFDLILIKNNFPDLFPQAIKCAIAKAPATKSQKEEFTKMFNDLIDG